jgi:tripartite-type tricarboxylate transporter receptor subunit TctC
MTPERLGGICGSVHYTSYLADAPHEFPANETPMPKPTLNTALFALMALPCLAMAQDYPVKPIRVVVPFPPAGVVDVLARVLAPPLGKALGQNIVIENRPGANTVIGTELVHRAPADGYSVLFMATSFTVNPYAHKKLPYDALRDFAGVTRLIHNPLIFCTHPSLPVKNMKELVVLAKARPGQLTWGVSSIIGGGRIAGELFKDVAKIDITNVPYGGGAAATIATIGGHTSMLVGNVLDCVQHIPNGKMRGIAVTSLTRSESLPQVPTIAESGWPGFESLNWFGAMVRAGSPRPAVEKLSAEIGRALQSAEVKDVLTRQGMNIGNMTPPEFDAYIRNEMNRNERILKKLGLTLD